MENSITVEEWLQELSRLEAHDENEYAMTSAEIAERSKMPIKRVQCALQKAVRSGAWECVKVWRQQISGAVHREPAYRPKGGINGA